jgi:hypothetical protein
MRTVRRSGDTLEVPAPPHLQEPPTRPSTAFRESPPEAPAPRRARLRRAREGSLRAVPHCRRGAADTLRRGPPPVAPAGRQGPGAPAAASLGGRGPRQAASRACRHAGVGPAPTVAVALGADVWAAGHPQGAGGRHGARSGATAPPATVTRGGAGGRAAGAGPRAMAVQALPEIARPRGHGRGRAQGS